MSKRTLIYLHLPKTAGTTFASILERCYPESARLHVLQRWVLEADHEFEPSFFQRIVREVVREEMSLEEVNRIDPLELVYGHLFYGYHELLQRDCDYFAFVRDPVRRLISEFNHANQPEHVMYSKMRDEGIDFEKYVTSGVALSADNLQTRMLCGEHPFLGFGECGEEHLETAKANLRKFKALGITERFNESLLVFGKEFGWSSSQLGFQNRRVGAAKSKVATLTERDLEIARKANRIDIALYEYAKTLFEEKLEAYPAGLEDDLSALEAACDEVAREGEGETASGGIGGWLQKFGLKKRP